MARQDVVRAVVPAERTEEICALLADEFDLEAADIEVEVPSPGRYRDEAPDRELRSLVRVGRQRMALGILLGAGLGLLMAWGLPMLRTYILLAGPLFAFAGAWAGGVVAAARGVQTSRDEGARGEQLIDVPDQHAAQDLRVLTIHDEHRRPAIADRLADHGLRLLDSQHPGVGRGPGERPADGGAGPAGPPAE
jgi:hypothetical protein